MDKKRTRSMNSMNGRGEEPSAARPDAELRRIASLPGPSLMRIEEHPQDHVALSGDGGIVTTITAEAAREERQHQSKLRRIASKPSQIFRSRIDTRDIATTKDEPSNLGNDVTHTPKIVTRRLRRMASMPARSLRRMTSRPNMPLQGPSPSVPSEEKRLPRMKSWSGSIRGSPFKILNRLNHNESDVTESQLSKKTSKGKQTTRRVQFATAELRPNFGDDSDEDDNASRHHVSLLPSSRKDEQYQDGDEKKYRWWRDDAFYAAMSVTIY